MGAEPYQPPERLAAIYRSAEAYVHASAEETFCLTAAEALACGTPVLAASAGGLGEVVDHERTGVLVAPGDERALAAAMQRLLDDPRLRSRMSASAAAERDRFDRDRMVHDIHALCADALDASDGTHPATRPT